MNGNGQTAVQVERERPERELEERGARRIVSGRGL
jgi:hypothetical protein